MSYMLLNGIPLALKKISDGRIVPHDFDNAEKWVIPPGGLTPPWMCVSLFPDIKYARLIVHIFCVDSKQLVKMKNKHFPPKLEVKKFSSVSSGSDNEKETLAPPDPVS